MKFHFITTTPFLVLLTVGMAADKIYLFMIPPHLLNSFILYCNEPALDVKGRKKSNEFSAAAPLQYLHYFGINENNK